MSDRWTDTLDRYCPYLFGLSLGIETQSADRGGQENLERKDSGHIARDGNDRDDTPP